MCFWIRTRAERSTSQSNNHLPKLTLCLLVTDKCIVSCRCFVHILYIYWLSVCFEYIWKDESQLWQGVICSFWFLAEPDMFLTDFYSVSLITRYTPGFHRAQKTDIPTFMCSHNGFHLSCSVWVCVCVSVSIAGVWPFCEWTDLRECSLTRGHHQLFVYLLQICVIALLTGLLHDALVDRITLLLLSVFIALQT